MRLLHLNQNSKAEDASSNLNNREIQPRNGSRTSLIREGNNESPGLIFLETFNICDQKVPNRVDDVGDMLKWRWIQRHHVFLGIEGPPDVLIGISRLPNCCRYETHSRDDHPHLNTLSGEDRHVYFRIMLPLFRVIGSRSEVFFRLVGCQLRRPSLHCDCSHASLRQSKLRRCNHTQCWATKIIFVSLDSMDGLRLHTESPRSKPSSSSLSLPPPLPLTIHTPPIYLSS